MSSWVVAVVRESVTVTVRVCVPISTWVGVHEKLPDEFIFELNSDVPLKESLTLYDGLVNPEVITVNERFVPTDTLVLGDSDCIETEALALAKASGTSTKLNPSTLMPSKRLLMFVSRDICLLVSNALYFLRKEQGSYLLYSIYTIKKHSYFKGLYAPLNY